MLTCSLIVFVVLQKNKKYTYSYNIMLTVTVDEDNVLECDMWIGSKKITLKSDQRDLIVNFTHGLLIDDIEEQREFETNNDEHLNN